MVDIPLAVEEQNIDLMWKVLVKEVFLPNQLLSFDHVYLGCTQRQCESSTDIVDNHRHVETRISAGAEEKLPCTGRLGADISSWSYDMEGHAKKWVARYCELANKATQQLYKVTTPSLDGHQFKVEELGYLLDNCQKYALNLSSNACIWHALVDQTFYRQ